MTKLRQNMMFCFVGQPLEGARGVPPEYRQHWRRGLKAMVGGVVRGREAHGPGRQAWCKTNSFSPEALAVSRARYCWRGRCEVPPRRRAHGRAHGRGRTATTKTQAQPGRAKTYAELIVVRRGRGWPGQVPDAL